MEVMRMIREFFKKLQADLNIRIDANSLSYIRLMNHIKFLLLRLNNNEELQMDITEFTKEKFATVYKGNIIKNLIMDCQSYTKYRPNETTGGIFVSWRRKEELPTGA